MLCIDFILRLTCRTKNTNHPPIRSCLPEWADTRKPRSWWHYKITGFKNIDANLESLKKKKKIIMQDTYPCECWSLVSKSAAWYTILWGGKNAMESDEFYPTTQQNCCVSFLLCASLLLLRGHIIHNTGLPPLLLFSSGKTIQNIIRK